MRAWPSGRGGGPPGPFVMRRALGLFFHVLAPMRNRDKKREVAEGVEAVAREEASYWLGMAIHRQHPQRVLSALRVLLTDPSRRL